MSLDRSSRRSCSPSAVEDLRARLEPAVLDRVPVEVPVGDRVIRAAVQDGSLVVVLCMPAGAFLDDEQQARLADLGFARDGGDRDGTTTRWWQQVELLGDGLGPLAATVVAALTGALAVPQDVVAADLRRSAPPGPMPFRPALDQDGVVADPAGLDLDYGAYLLAAAATPGALWAATPPVFAAIVPVADPASVRELVALAPGPDGGAAWFRRTRHGWIADPTVRRRLVERAGQEVRQGREALRLLDPGCARDLEGRLRFDVVDGPGNDRGTGLS